MIAKYISDFIRHYPMFRLKPSLENKIILEGIYENTLFHEQHGEVPISYKLVIHIPEDYPLSLPVVFEPSNRIEKISDNHVNYDGSLCLGAPIRLKMIIKRNVSLAHFFENCVLPYLFAVTLKINKGSPFIFGELAHGNTGLIEDFKNLFKLSEDKQVYDMLILLSKNKKEANRSICPCGCNKRLSTCQYFKIVQQMRKLFSRSEWEEQYSAVKRGF